MRPKNSDYKNDTEFQQFQESIKDKSPSTAKSYKASYKKSERSSWQMYPRHCGRNSHQGYTSGSI